MQEKLDEALVSEWTTAVEALDSDNLKELFDIQPELLWTPLDPLSHLETDFSHFVRQLEDHKLLGTTIRPVYALHHVLYDYGVPDDEWAVERAELVDYILKRTKGNELNTCLWGENNTVMHLAYFLQQPELIQQLIEHGALSDIPNKFGHLPVDNKEEPKLLKSKNTMPKDRLQQPTNASDRFKRLRELAESPNAVAGSNKKLTERQNSTRRYFQPGHLEERKRRVLSEEEEAELEKQRLQRQKDIDQLAQRSAVKNNPLFKKFEEQQQQQQTARRTPSISAASAVRDRKKLLGATDQIRRTSRVINSLKDRSYVSGSVFRQAQETEESTKRPTLAQFRGTSAKDTALSNVKEAEEEEETEIADKLVLENKSNEKKETPIIEKNDAIDENVQADDLTIKNDSNLANKNKTADSNTTTKKEATNSTLDRNIHVDKNTVTDKKTTTTEDEIESLSIGKLGHRGLESNLKSKKTEIDLMPSKVKQIVNVHEHLNDEEEIEIQSAGKKFTVWKKNGTGEAEEEKGYERGFYNKKDESNPIKAATPSVDKKSDLSTKESLSSAPVPEKKTLNATSTFTSTSRSETKMISEKKTLDDKFVSKSTTKDLAPTTNGKTTTSADQLSSSKSNINPENIKVFAAAKTMSDHLKSKDPSTDSRVSTNNDDFKAATAVEKTSVRSAPKLKNDIESKSTSAATASSAEKVGNKLPSMNGNTSSSIDSVSSAETAKPPLPAKSASRFEDLNSLNVERKSTITFDSTGSSSSKAVQDGSKSSLISNSSSVDYVSTSMKDINIVKSKDTDMPVDKPSVTVETNHIEIKDDEFKEQSIYINAYNDSKVPADDQQDKSLTSESLGNKKKLESYDDLAFFSDDETFDNQSPITSIEPSYTSAESELSPIPTSTNQVEYSHTKLKEPKEISISKNSKDPHISKTQSNNKYSYVSTVKNVEEEQHEPNRVLHLEINTNKSQMMIEEESDEDEATTPTMANPHSYQKKAVVESESEDEESRHEWKSAYDQLMSNQQQVEFEDDILEHHNKTMNKSHGDDRFSMSSDLDETSILQTLSYQNEARVDSWTTQQKQQQKRQSGTQKSQWSTGIQHADALKRESLVSKGESEDQWYDPDDEWSEQQERRQSMFHVPPHEDYYYKESNRQSDSSLNTNSETYSFKNSNSTENTNHDEEEDDRKKFQQEMDEQYSPTSNYYTTPLPPTPERDVIEEEEEDDYYSTNLHQSAQKQARGESSYYHGGHSDNEEEGEITIFMDQSNEIKSRSMQKTSEDITTSFFKNSAKPVVAHQATPTPLTATTITNFSSSTLSVNRLKEDDEVSLIKVPSRTVAIAEAGNEQEEVPHDPNHPRVEDISHYMNKLPDFEKNKDHGSSAFDIAAMEGGGGLENETVVIKRAISSLQPNHGQQPVEQNRGIPNAHEINPELLLLPERQAEKMSSMEVTDFGKMYIGVSGAHYMLLPMPKEITYVRCVISDGEYEYMSKYEILGHQTLMDYECVIDTKPGMIITVSLHVRPDYHVKPRTGWSKWFTSIRKQKEHLSGYVHPEDGAIGQTRFAVDHMVPGCYKKTYESHFDCFNSWYARTTRERARREQFGDDEDFLKIVGKLNVEMLYLPVSNPSVPVPRSLRECDLTLKIRQWHDTCWQSGYLSTRRHGQKVWERHYYRLIGSQLIGYTEGAERQVWDHYNISDVIRLSAAADKVIVTLVEDEKEEKVFGTEEPIHAENHKGFFRLSFPDYYLDCVSDDLEESEEWVKTLKSMIGRVPLRLPFSD